MRVALSDAIARPAEQSEGTLLRAVAEAVSAPGEALFDALARHAATALGFRHALIGELTGPGRVRTLGQWGAETRSAGEEWDVESGTPAREAAEGRTVDHSENAHGASCLAVPLMAL